MNAVAIETLHKGIRFRSRMEARWAVFMDTLGIPYDYEPEGFELGGLRYLPDFYLPNQDAYLEIKNPNAEPVDFEKIKRLVLATKKTVFVLSSNPEVPSWDSNQRVGAFMNCYMDGVDIDGKPYTDQVGEDHPYLWCECPKCRRCELQFDGRADRINCNCPRDGHGDKGYNFDSPRLIKAYETARGFRFEQQRRED